LGAVGFEDRVEDGLEAGFGHELPFLVCRRRGQQGEAVIEGLRELVEDLLSCQEVGHPCVHAGARAAMAVVIVALSV